MEVGSPITTKTLRMSKACAASKSPCTRKMLRPRVGKCSTVSRPTSFWMRWQTAQGLIRIRAMGLSATLMTSAPTSASRLAPASSLRLEMVCGGSISTEMMNLPAANFCASCVGCSSGETGVSVGTYLSTARSSSGPGGASKAARIAAMWAGVVPQQPPMSAAPTCRKANAYSAK